ncbi:MAG: hypothetical protein R3B48_00230 [Kofleriaceae bacterium]
MASREVWKRRLGPLYGGAVALTSSSSLPWRSLAEEDDAPAAGWILAIGAAFGAVAWGVAAAALALGLPAAACTALALLVAIALGGAVVERSLIEYITRIADAAMATTVTAGAVVLRVELLAAIAPDRWLWAFPATWLIGRWSATFLQAIGDPIHDAPARSLVAAPPPAWLMGAATAVVMIATAAALGWTMVIALALAAAVAFALGLTAQRRRGGIDAAVVGAAALAGELVTLLVLAAT